MAMGSLNATRSPVLASTGSLARTKGIELRSGHLPPDLPVGYGDERRLAQVLLNQRDQVHGYRLRGGERRRTTYQRWSAAAPDGFAFAVKAPKEITHALRLAGADAALDAFLEQVTGLGGKLGPLLFQLRPSLAFDPQPVGAFFAACARSTRNRPLLPRPINDVRSLPHGLAQLPEKLGRSG
jgi:hypothetical protein